MKTYTPTQDVVPPAGFNDPCTLALPGSQVVQRFFGFAFGIRRFSRWRVAGRSGLARAIAETQ